MSFDRAVFGVSIAFLSTGLGLLFISGHVFWGILFTCIGGIGIAYSVLKYRTGPLVEPLRYGKTDDGVRAGVYVALQGSPVYEVQIEPITLLGEWTINFDNVLSRLEGQGFFATRVRRGSVSTGYAVMDLNSAWKQLQEAAGLPSVFPLIIKYRDAHGRWYRSVCELHRDVLMSSGFDVKFIRKESIRRWPWLKQSGPASL